MGNGSIFSYLNTTGGATTIAIAAIIVTSLLIMSKMTGIKVYGVIQGALRGFIRVFGKLVHRTEKKYHRDYEIGKINEKTRKVKIYRFLNELTIDLDLKRAGATPYQFLFIVLLGSFFLTVVICRALFGGLLLVPIMFPIVFAGVMSILYTRANIAHDGRIEDVIEAENIICNNIKDGVVVAVRNSVDMMPISVRGYFKDFLDNIEHKNYHIKSALLDLNNNLGSISDDFIKKCIILETEEEHGIIGMFNDVIEINNIKMEERTDMKRRFEEVVTEFVIGAVMIFVFLVGVMVVYDNVADFYLRNPLGQIILALDILLLISEFVFITYLRAKEI